MAYEFQHVATSFLEKRHRLLFNAIAGIFNLLIMLFIPLQEYNIISLHNKYISYFKFDFLIYEESVGIGKKESMKENIRISRFDKK